MQTIKEKAEALALAAGMQFDSRYNHWICPRGQFEGEEWFAPYYWNLTMNGEGETIFADTEEDADETPGADLFHVDAEESDAFDIVCGRWILVRKDSQGFVIVTDHETREEAEKRFADWLR